MEEKQESFRSELAKLKGDLDIIQANASTAAQQTLSENLTVVIGNAPNADTLDKVKDWIHERCKDTGVPTPLDPYVKEGDFKSV
eukprot:8641256-Pyramimonas_sp.AAC.1